MNFTKRLGNIYGLNESREIKNALVRAGLPEDEINAIMGDVLLFWNQTLNAGISQVVFEIRVGPSQGLCTQEVTRHCRMHTDQGRRIYFIQ